MKAAVLAILLYAIPAAAAPVPTHLFPRKEEWIVPGAEFKWSSDTELIWVVDTIWLDGRVYCKLRGNKDIVNWWKPSDIEARAIRVLPP